MKIDLRKALAVLLGLWLLVIPIHAQDETDGSTFGDAMYLLAEELDASAEHALTAMDDEGFATALNRMDYLLEQIILLQQPASTDACQLKSTLTQWANFQVRAFRNYPDRTYDYLYHDTRNQFWEMLNALPASTLEQPYTVTVDAFVMEEPTEEEAVNARPTLPLPLVREWQLPGWDSTAIAYSPDGNTLLQIGSHTSRVLALDVETDDPVLVTNTLRMDVSASTDGSVLAAVDPTVGVAVWQTDTWEVLTMMPIEALITEVAMSGDGAMIAAGSDDGVTVWEHLQRHQLLPGSVIHGLTFNPDGSRLAVGVVRSGDVDPGVVIYDTADWGIVQQWASAVPDQNGETVVNELIFSPDSRYLAVVCSRTGVCLYDVASGERITGMPGSVFARDAAFSPNGAYLAVVGGEYLHLYEVESATLIHQQTTSGQHAYLNVAFAPGGAQIAVTDVDGVRVFDVSNLMD